MIEKQDFGKAFVLHSIFKFEGVILSKNRRNEKQLFKVIQSVSAYLTSAKKAELCQASISDKT